ncbi:hypothetical protein N665_0126s0060 [Sinapis alba]|nr:hypothetical protein N665_0126s0060 [Sinapis alba]
MVQGGGWAHRSVPSSSVVLDEGEGVACGFLNILQFLINRSLQLAQLPPLELTHQSLRLCESFACQPLQVDVFPVHTSVAQKYFDIIERLDQLAYRIRHRPLNSHKETATGRTAPGIWLSCTTSPRRPPCHCLLLTLRKRGLMYTIEFQKRGMSHTHILLFMEKESKFPTADDIDKIICVEIPYKSTVYPELYEIIGNCMMHGPCSATKKDNVCMINSKCSKMFPKPLNIRTAIDANGFPAYMRRLDGRFIEKNGIRLDNRNVVPYNKELMLRYRAHMNVEWCI